MSEYYQDKIEILQDIFNTNNIILQSDLLIIENKNYPILNDVIILIDENKYSDYVCRSLQKNINSQGFFCQPTPENEDVKSFETPLHTDLGIGTVYHSYEAIIAIYRPIGRRFH